MKQLTHLIHIYITQKRPNKYFDYHFNNSIYLSLIYDLLFNKS